MSDNTVLSSGTGGDTIRDVDKSGIKTQVTLLDVGGAGAENLFSVGQKLAINSISIVLASDQATIPVSATSLPLPSGASTGALQTTGNTSLASIDTKTPVLGQAVAAASVPVVLTAAQLTTLTPFSSVSVSNFPASQAVTGTFWQATQPVSGTVGISGSVVFTNANLDVALSTRTKPSDQQHVTVDGGVITAIANALPAGNNLLGSVGIDSGTATVTGSITADAGKDLNTTTLNTTLTSALTNGALPLLLAILTEMRITNYYLQAGLNVRDEPDVLRADPYFNTLQ